MQKIVLFIEPNRTCGTPSKIGNLCLNRVAIDDDANFEILGIYQVVERFKNLCFGYHDDDSRKPVCGWGIWQPGLGLTIDKTFNSFSNSTHRWVSL